MRATIVDLRYLMKDVLGALDRGEPVIVLYRGKEKATLTPISSGANTNNISPKAEDQPMFGLWSDRKDMVDPSSYVRELRQSRAFADGSRPQSKSARKRRK